MLPFILFFIGILGFVLNRKNIILIIISIEFMLLSAALVFLQFSNLFEDVLGQIITILIITITGAEIAIGLAILISYYRLKGSISLQSI